MPEVVSGLSLVGGRFRSRFSFSGKDPDVPHAARSSPSWLAALLVSACSDDDPEPDIADPTPSAAEYVGDGEYVADGVRRRRRWGRRRRCGHGSRPRTQRCRRAIRHDAASISARPDCRGCDDYRRVDREDLRRGRSFRGWRMEIRSARSVEDASPNSGRGQLPPCALHGRDDRCPTARCGPDVTTTPGSASDDASSLSRKSGALADFSIDGCRDPSRCSCSRLWSLLGFAAQHRLASATSTRTVIRSTATLSRSRSGLIRELGTSVDNATLDTATDATQTSTPSASARR